MAEAEAAEPVSAVGGHRERRQVDGDRLTAIRRPAHTCRPPMPGVERAPDRAVRVKVKYFGNGLPVLAEDGGVIVSDGLRQLRRDERKAVLVIEREGEARHRFRRRRWLRCLDGLGNFRRGWFGHRFRQLGGRRGGGHGGGGDCLHRGRRSRHCRGGFHRADDEEEAFAGARCKARRTGRPFVAADGKLALGDARPIVRRCRDEGIDGARRRRQFVVAARGAEHLAVAIEHRGETIVLRDDVGEPLGTGGNQLRRRCGDRDGENGACAVGEVEAAARGRHRGEGDSLADAQHLEARGFGRQQPRQPGDLRLERVQWRKAVFKDVAHAPLAEEGDAGCVGPQNPGAIAAEYEGRRRFQQRRANRSERDQVKIGIGLAVHPVGPSSRTPIRARLTA